MRNLGTQSKRKKISVTDTKIVMFMHVQYERASFSVDDLAASFSVDVRARNCLSESNEIYHAIS